MDQSRRMAVKRSLTQIDKNERATVHRREPTICYLIFRNLLFHYGMYIL